MLALSLGLLACSAVTSRPEPASAPLHVDPVNSRYLSDRTGKVVYLVGSHTWTNLQDLALRNQLPVFDYAGYLMFLERYHLNFIRLWRQEEALWEPLPYLRTGSALALDGEPRFDLNQWNPAFFQRLSARVGDAGARGIYVGVMLFQGWGIERKDPARREDPWWYHPFNKANNVNGVDGDADGNGDGSETHSLVNPTVTGLQESFVRKVIDVLNPFDNVIYEIANESTPVSMPWQEHLVRLIHDHERTKPKQHPVLLTAPWNNREEDLWASEAEAVSPILPAPGAAAYAYRDDPPPNDGRKVIVNDTDHLWGIGGTSEWVWKSFVRGLNPIFMDPYDPGAFRRDYEQVKETREAILLSLGQTRRYAERMPLRTMVPRTELCSTGYCLADPGRAYLIYVPFSGGALDHPTVQVDLSGHSGRYHIEWYSPKLSAVHAASVDLPGESVSLTAPFPGESVLYLYSDSL